LWAHGRLHQGELEAIILAQELSADFVILDDLLARRKAQRLEINVIGTLGLLLLFEKRGLLTAEKVWQKNNPIDPATWPLFITQNTTANSNKTSWQ